MIYFVFVFWFWFMSFVCLRYIRTKASAVDDRQGMQAYPGHSAAWTT